MIRTARRITGVDTQDTALLLEAFLEVIKDAVIRGEKVNLRGFGTFLAKKQKTKVARHIGKNSVLIVPERHVPGFKPSKIFSQKVQEGLKKPPGND